ncbi:MAG TPA: iron-containing alcohol dehydrogenase, partial [Acidimicrobiia bacterium]|nr:iron-containing alcohol dehydrogenase [Acidimicrobiia bacterium]
MEGVIGPGAAATLGDLDRGPRLVVVTDGHLAASPALDSVCAIAAPDALIVLRPGEPTTSSVTELADGLGGDATVVAVGGGSVIDSAKLAAAVTGSSSQIDRHLMSAEPFAASMKVVAVPTTAGAGAEVTRTCVITDGGHKTWAWDELLRPASIVLDGTLTVGLPPATTVATGLDAVVHAIEAVTAQHRDETGYSAGLWALAELAACLPAVVADPGDFDARGRALVASTAAGLAIDRCATGIGHGLGHALGSLVPVPHG